MKIKASILAVNKNLFFGLGLVLFTSLVLLINWLFNLPVIKADALNMQLAKTEQQIKQLKSLETEFVLQSRKTYDPLSEDKILTQHDAVMAISAIRHDIEYYKDHRLVSDNTGVLSALDDLSASLDKFENSLNDFILTSKEKGNENSGLVSRWREISSRMVVASQGNGPAFVKQLEQLKQLEINYLLNNDPKITGEIAALSGEIRNTLTPKEGGISMADLDSYLAITSSLTALEERMDKAGLQAMGTSSDKSIDTLLSCSDTAQTLMNAVIAKLRLRWIVLRYLVITLFTLACILLLILITSKGITQPLSIITRYMKKLAAGELPDDPVESSGLREIRVIDHIMNDMVKGLKEKVDLSRSLNLNDLDARLELSGPNDILGQQLIILQQKLHENAALQRKNDEENSKRRYINEGLAQFAEILRTQSNELHTLGDVFIRDIVKYMNAIQGGFFLKDDSGTGESPLELISAFAYNRKKYFQKTLLPGEGLVGTCAREKQIINLTEIPEGYITITSGLGDTQPDNLLLVPVLHENELIGVLEIASLHRYKDHEIQFAGEVAGSLGATIVYARNNQRTSELLTRSQQQAIHMAEQEEEMRQNMEELKATQEESTRREEEFRGIAETIGHSLFILEYNLDGTLRNANEKLCIFLGLTRNEIIGKAHEEIMKGTLIPDTLFWDELQHQKQMTQVEKVKIGKKEYVLKEHFASVISHNGTLVYFINFITEMSK
jgi:PAS domain S-box-containing protein